ncbi:MAG: hypothetical protein JKY37_06280 [Nannocystaceae bacterium]|nr:hypothetical protein [Nannocystaceae bacterium]
MRSGETAPPPGPAVDLEEEDMTPLSAAAFSRVLPRLNEAENRDEITTLLLSFLGEGFGRVVLFVHTQGMLRGRDCRGEDLLVDAVRQVRIPMSGPSTFAAVIDSGVPHFGPWPQGSRVNELFAAAMGGIRGNVLVLPVRLGVRVPLIVFAANTPHPVDPRSLAELVDGVSGALERLIRARKSQDNLPAVD